MSSPASTSETEPDFEWIELRRSVDRKVVVDGREVNEVGFMGMVKLFFSMRPQDGVGLVPPPGWWEDDHGSVVKSVLGTYEGVRRFEDYTEGFKLRAVKLYKHLEQKDIIYKDDAKEDEKVALVGDKVHGTLVSFVAISMNLEGPEKMAWMSKYMSNKHQAEYLARRWGIKAPTGKGGLHRFGTEFEKRFVLVPGFASTYMNETFRGAGSMALYTYKEVADVVYYPPEQE